MPRLGHQRLHNRLSKARKQVGMGRARKIIYDASRQETIFIFYGGGNDGWVFKVWAVG
jgi:hypothetical protein